MFFKGPSEFQVSTSSHIAKLHYNEITIRNTGFHNKLSMLYIAIETPNYFYHVSLDEMGIRNPCTIEDVAIQMSQLFISSAELLKWAQKNAVRKQKLCDDSLIARIKCVPLQDAAILEDGITLPLVEQFGGQYSVSYL